QHVEEKADIGVDEADPDDLHEVRVAEGLGQQAADRLTGESVEQGGDCPQAIVIVAGGLFALLLAMSEGESWGWYSYRVLGLIIYSVLSLALFVVIELEVDEPLLDIRIFRYWPFTNSLLLISVLSVVLLGVLFYVPQFLQVAQGGGRLTVV
ncbi:MAG: hypothetical protein H0V41_06240, partial [Pseudonocardiales bacterium]|nr:hypothetical protein [Pseudonocardiales bacterium]